MDNPVSEIRQSETNKSNKFFTIDIICGFLGLAILLIYILHFKDSGGKIDGLSNSFLKEKGCLVTATAPSKALTLAPGSDGQLLSVNGSASGGLKWVSPIPPVTRYFVSAQFTSIEFSYTTENTKIPISSKTENAAFGFDVKSTVIDEEATPSPYCSFTYNGESGRTFLCTYTGVVKSNPLRPVSPHFSISKGGADCLLELAKNVNIIAGSTMFKLNTNEQVYLQVKTESDTSYNPMTISYLDLNLVSVD